MNMDKIEISKMIAAELGMDEIKILPLLVMTPSKDGIAFPAFSLAKAMKMSPPQIVTKLAVSLDKKKPYWLAKVEASGPYLNFYSY